MKLLMIPCQAMSIKKAAKIANAFVGDGIRQSTARELGRKGRSRDFWRWMKLPFDPYPVELPLNKSGLDPHVVMENTNFVLPSDMLAEMLRQNVRLVFLTSTFVRLPVSARHKHVDVCFYLRGPKVGYLRLRSGRTYILGYLLGQRMC